MSLGKNISYYRKKENLSQEQLAEKIKVTRQTISNWELDVTIPDTYQLIELTKELCVKIDQLIPNTINKKQNEVWEEVLDLIKMEIDEISFKLWFNELEFINIQSSVLKIRCPYYIHTKKIKDEYETLIVNTFNKISEENIKEIKCYES